MTEAKDKKLFINRHNPTEGITAHTVNVGPTTRTMTSQWGQELGQELLFHFPKSARVLVKSVLGDGESFEFAHQVLEWLKDNGYDADGVTQLVHSRPVMGQHINELAEDKYELIIGASQ